MTTVSSRPLQWCIARRPAGHPTGSWTVRESSTDPADPAPVAIPIETRNPDAERRAPDDAEAETSFELGADPRFRVNEEWMIPVAKGHSVDIGWTEATGFRPAGVTWHWTVTERIEGCRRLLGGPNALRKGQASAHYAVGRTFEQGIDRYVSLENRSWHAGLHQTLRWDGRTLKDPAHKGSRTTIGIETVNAGFARHDRPPGPDWIAADGPEGQKMLVQPWTEAQIHMMVAVGREILDRWPDIDPREHHGHHDLCPLYKVDPAGFPFATILRRIYEDPSIPDVWTPLGTNPGRRRALAALGFPMEPEVDGADWGAHAIRALRHFQWSHELAVNGVWTVWVSWKVHDLLAERGEELATVVRKKPAGTA